MRTKKGGGMKVSIVLLGIAIAILCGMNAFLFYRLEPILQGELKIPENAKGQTIATRCQLEELKANIVGYGSLEGVDGYIVNDFAGLVYVKRVDSHDDYVQIRNSVMRNDYRWIKKSEFYPLYQSFKDISIEINKLKEKKESKKNR